MTCRSGLLRVSVGIMAHMKAKKKVLSPAPLCICGTKLIGRFRELGKCRGCVNMIEKTEGKTFVASDKCREYWLNRGFKDGNKDGDDAPAK